MFNWLKKIFRSGKHKGQDAGVLAQPQRHWQNGEAGGRRGSGLFIGAHRMAEKPQQAMMQAAEAPATMPAPETAQAQFNPAPQTDNAMGLTNMLQGVTNLAVNASASETQGPGAWRTQKREQAEPEFMRLEDSERYDRTRFDNEAKYLNRPLPSGLSKEEQELELLQALQYIEGGEKSAMDHAVAYGPQVLPAPMTAHAVKNTMPQAQRAKLVDGN